MRDILVLIASYIHSALWDIDMFSQRAYMTYQIQPQKQREITMKRALNIGGRHTRHILNNFTLKNYTTFSLINQIKIIKINYITVVDKIIE